MKRLRCADQVEPELVVVDNGHAGDCDVVIGRRVEFGSRRIDRGLCVGAGRREKYGNRQCEKVEKGRNYGERGIGTRA